MEDDVEAVESLVWLDVAGEAVVPALFSAHVVEDAACEERSVAPGATFFRPVCPDGQNHVLYAGEVFETDSFEPLATGVWFVELESI